MTEDTKAAEKTPRRPTSGRHRRVRLRTVIYPIRKSIPEHFSRTGDSEQIAAGFGVNRTDVLDRATHSLYRHVENLDRRLEMLEAWRLMGCQPAKEEIERKPIRSEHAISIVRGKTA